jgi:hypothetical protein
LAELRQYIESFWDDVLRAFGQEAERMANIAPIAESKSDEKKLRKQSQ